MKPTPPRKLLETLRNRTSEFAQKFPSKSIKNVTQIVEYQVENPQRRVPYRAFFNSPQDFYLYHELHPEWKGKSSGEMQKDRVAGGYKFIDVFSRWVSEHTESEEQRREVVANIIPLRIRRVSPSISLDDWVDEMQSHPDWADKNAGYAKEDPEFSKFYYRFQRWIKDSIDDEFQRREAVKSLFKSGRNPRRKYTSIDDWKKEFNEHPQWKNKSIKEMQKDTRTGGLGFYQSFRKWTKNNSQSRDEEQKYLSAIFTSKITSRAHYKEFSEWKDEFDEHPEWLGLPIMVLAKEKGAGSFYSAFLRWLNKNAKSEKKKQEWLRSLFPEVKSSIVYTSPTEDIKFDSYHEFVLGIVLKQYGLIERFSEGENVHVRTNGTKRNSIDFLVGKSFIEFHPINWYDRKRGINHAEEFGEYKIETITNERYADHWFWHLQDIHELYDVLQDSLIKPLIKPKFKNRNKEEFSKDISDAYRIASQYIKDEKIAA